ncbi:MAG: TOBE domain-containing protein, partial [Proteobacteria bacterium]|nr:TOBE domain-containing protein [Pseudomonadota bacterium]
TLRDRLTGEIRSILKKLGVTAIFVTHDQAEAFSVADKVAVLHNGVLQQFGSPEELYRHPQNATVAAFLGFTNLVDGSLDEAGVCHCPIGRLPLPGPSMRPRPKVTLLIRPEGSKMIIPPTKPDPARPELSGTVTNRLFQGGSYRVTLQCQTYSLTFDLPIDPPPPEVGMPIHLSVNPAALILLD